MRQYALVFFCLLGAAQAHAAGGTLAVVPERPVAGKAVVLRYAPPATGLQAGKPVKAVIYLYCDFAWRPDSLTLAPGAGGWQATYTVPTNCAFAALRFYQGSVGTAAATDSLAQQGFYFVPRDKKGRKLPGGAIGEAIFRQPTLAGSRLPAFFPDKAARPAPAELEALLKEELARKDASPKQFVEPYLAIEHVLLGKEFRAKGAPVLVPLLQAPLPDKEADLMTLHRVLKYELKDEAQASQLEATILQRYPHGNFARMVAYAPMGKGGKPEVLIRNGEKFLAEFPARELGPGHNQAHLYFETYRLLGMAYFETRAFDKLLALQPQWNYKTEDEVYRWNVLRAYTFKLVRPDSLYPVSTAMIKDLLAKANDGSYTERGVFTPAQAQAQARKNLDERLGTHVALLYDMHKNQEALDYLALLSPQGKYADASLNEKHLRLLDELHRPAEAVALLENSVRTNALTPAMTARLQQAYQASHKSLAGYDQYLASLRSGEELAKMHAYVQKNLTNQEYRPFALEDASGRLVRSSDWDGKIVVLDFWATWCGPCIRAFPGMQVLVDKYAKDPQVDFYFVGTMQNGNYKEKDINYVKQEGYRFKLLFDAVNPDSGEQNVVFRSFVPFFTSSGIPRKVILKDGVMRYTSEGYSGSPSQLADEISYAIELLKKG